MDALAVLAPGGFRRGADRGQLRGAGHRVRQSASAPATGAGGAATRKIMARTGRQRALLIDIVQSNGAQPGTFLIPPGAFFHVQEQMHRAFQ